MCQYSREHRSENPWHFYDVKMAGASFPTRHMLPRPRHSKNKTVIKITRVSEVASATAWCNRQENVAGCRAPFLGVQIPDFAIHCICHISKNTTFKSNFWKSKILIKMKINSQFPLISLLVSDVDIDWSFPAISLHRILFLHFFLAHYIPLLRFIVSLSSREGRGQTYLCTLCLSFLAYHECASGKEIFFWKARDDLRRFSHLFPLVEPSRSTTSRPRWMSKFHERKMPNMQ